MVEIYIEYNPFTLEFIIKQDGKDFYKDSKIHQYKEYRLQNWVDKLIPAILEVTESKFNLVFKGTILDYEDIKDEALKFNEKENKEIVTLSYIDIRTVNDRLKELKELFNYMQDTTPFEELKTEDVIRKFYKAINKELEIVSIATISAGKSTLINSLLGKKLLPIKESSCTSTIIKIKDVKGSENIPVCFKDNDNNIIETIDNADYIIMEKFNSDSRVSYIDVEADVQFIETNDMNVVLLDTPGYTGESSDSSLEEDDKNMAIEGIKGADYVIWVIDITNGTIKEDDIRFLEDYAYDKPKIIVLNKADLLPKSRAEEVYNNVKSTLEDEGLDDIQIHFYSSIYPEDFKESSDALFKVFTSVNKKIKLNSNIIQDTKDLFSDFVDYYNNIEKDLKLETEIFNIAKINSIFNLNNKANSISSSLSNVKEERNNIEYVLKELKNISFDMENLFEKAVANKNSSINNVVLESDDEAQNQ